MTTSFHTARIPWDTNADLVSAVNALNAKRIIYVRECLPDDASSISNWSEVYYEYQTKGD